MSSTESRRVCPTNAFVEFKKAETEQSIPARFEQQVRRHPTRLAVKGRSYALTYDELNHAANRVAHALLAQRAGGEEPIGLLLGHGAPMIVAILGVLKAGKIYLPLDSSYPPARINYILEDSQAKFIMADGKNLSLAKEWAQNGQQVLNIDELDPNLSDQNLGLAIPPNALAYILYTSGSTGQPKGVMQNHRNVLHNIMKYTNGSHICADDRLSLLFSYSYSAAVTNTFGTLLNGAALFPFDPREEGLASLATRLIQEEITVYHSVPTVFRHLLDTLTGTEEFPKLRLIELTGEPVSPTDIARYKQHFPQHCLLHNRMAATEMSIIRQYFIDRETPITGGVVPVGYAVADTEILLLDETGQEVGTNQTGEIAIKSRYLVPGYWRKPELTRAVFLPDPNGGEERIYRTGDLGCLLPDGCLLHLGRKDFQVKIRGHRIEVGEIELALLDSAAIKEAVVMAREDKAGDKYLVAYVVPAQGTTPTTHELRRLMRARLPEYMVPSTFVRLDALPLTPNGKVDRLALPAPDRVRSDLNGTFVAPRTPVEEVLAGIWTQVLGVKQVGIHDNFLELGGHSLLAIRIISKVIAAFRVELSLQALFEAPTVAAMAAVLVENQAKKAGREETARLLAELQGLSEEDVQGASIANAQAIARREVSSPCPLSFAQQRLWFLDQLEPGSAAYNIPLAVRLQGRLNVEALHQTLDALVARHEALRTTFAAVDGSPVQVVAEPRPVDLPLMDLSTQPEPGRQAVMQACMRAEARRRFDLARDLMLRAILLRLGPAEHALLLTMHHIASDGWSMGILSREVTALYDAFSSGRLSPLPELPIQYADYAVWQRQWLQGEVLENQLVYWRQQLAGPLPGLQLPPDHPRPAAQTSRGARHAVTLPAPLTQVLQALSQRAGVTLFMTLLAAFQVLLQRYTGQDEIIVGSPIAGRNRAELEGLIGFFVNTLILHTDLSGDPPFRELLGRVREVALGAYAHQELPFERLVEKLHPERSLGNSPLFQVMFAFQNFPRPLELPGMALSPLDVHTGAAKFDLSLELRHRPEDVSGWFEYNIDLFDATTIARMAGHFQTLLAGIVANPARRLSDLTLLTAAERQQVLVTWNNTWTAYSEEACLHTLVDAQVERTPDAVAVTCGDASLTYQELNARANRLAHYLRGSGVGPGVLVGIYLERSLEIVIGLLGILKAGGAYVPLDPAYPKERLAFMLADSQAPVLLTQQRLLKGLPPHQARTVCLDTDWAAIAQEPAENPASGTAAAQLAYVIYTSGSTGQPKGVQIPHRAVVNFLESMRQQPGLTAHDVLLAVTTLSFDIAALELFLPLSVGARVVLVSRAVATDGRQLGQVLADTQATVMQATPATWRLLLEAGWAGSPQLTVLCGGETLPRELAQQLLARAAAVWNLYGPTETTIWSGVAKVEPGDRPVPIGRPIANTQFYLLDRHLQPVPVGVPGELYIGGHGVARGYLNRPELTAERFVPNPFRDEPEARLYKTGDLARYRPNGMIEFLGRLDHQVKIRGYRVELGEIEAVLGQHPAVRESVVLAREEVPGEKRLVAYVVANQPPGPSISELRRLLQATLPDYMVPAAFVALESLPLTPNGKVDRRGLPAPDQARPTLEDAFVAPRTPVEAVLAGIWADVLGLTQVGIHDNFFALGGHSLLATQVISRLQAAFQVEVPLRQLFEAPTVAELATYLETVRWAAQDRQAPLGAPVDDREEEAL